MTRPVWKGYISFGLVAIPVSLYSGEERNELRFHLLDSRDKSRIHYERISTETGREVPWDKVVKAYEFKKGNYVILEEDFKKSAPEGFKSIDIEEFVNLNEINSLYFDRPYYAVPDGANQKAYILLREALKKTQKVGVAKIVIRTKQYLAIVLPSNNALILNLIRFKQELKNEEEFALPKGGLKTYRIHESEITMATELINNMTKPWKPEKYHDEYREILMKWIDQSVKGKKVTKKAEEKTKIKADDVIDFMSLLKKSLQKKANKGSAKITKKTIRKKHRKDTA